MAIFSNLMPAKRRRRRGGEWNDTGDDYTGNYGRHGRNHDYTNDTGNGRHNGGC